LKNNIGYLKNNSESIRKYIMQPFLSFVDLFLKYKSYTDKEAIHHYGIWYDRWIACNSNVSQILELGCDSFGCGGLLAFSERFPEATVVGIDTHYWKIADQVQQNPRVVLLTGDVYQYETTTLVKDNRLSPFQIIIDDCLHSPVDQMKAFRFWSPLLSQDGMYFIEDIYDLSMLSKMLSLWTIDWDVIIGDNRELFPGTYKESIIMCLRRNMSDRPLS
jgi:hypothetical protein